MSEAVLTTQQLARRWRTSDESVTASWRAGRIPRPINPHQAHSYRWALVQIEAFERGDWQPEAVAS